MREVPEGLSSTALSASGRSLVHSLHEKSCEHDLPSGLLLLALCGICASQKLAIAVDDLPLNGDLPPGVTLAETAKNVLAILQKRHVPAVYGFINAKKLILKRAAKAASEVKNTTAS